MRGGRPARLQASETRLGVESRDRGVPVPFVEATSVPVLRSVLSIRRGQVLDHLVLDPHES